MIFKLRIKFGFIFFVINHHVCEDLEKDPFIIFKLVFM